MGNDKHDIDDDATEVSRHGQPPEDQVGEQKRQQEDFMRANERDEVVDPDQDKADDEN